MIRIDELTFLLLRSESPFIVAIGVRNKGWNEQQKINNKQVTELIVRRDNNRRLAVKDSESKFDKEFEMFF